MWWTDGTYRVIVEDRIRQFSREVERDRQARQAAPTPGPAAPAFVRWLNGMSWLVLRRPIRPLSEPDR